MSAALLDELLAGFVGPAARLSADATPANSANLANRFAGTYPAPAVEVCEALRIDAKTPLAEVDEHVNSQEIASIRNRLIEPHVLHSCGPSQLSQLSHAVCPSNAFAGTWTDAEIARFMDRRARMLRWGWTLADAERLAERLVNRDREEDTRVSCTDCTHYRPGRCGNYAGAGLTQADIGRDLATLLQHCAGFEPLTLR